MPQIAQINTDLKQSLIVFCKKSVQIICDNLLLHILTGYEVPVRLCI